MTAAGHEPRRAIVLVDAEHQAQAVASALERLAASGDDPVLAVYMGGSEKVDRPGEPPDVGYPSIWPTDPVRGLLEAIERHQPDVVIDRTADPVVADRQRLQVASSVLAVGVAFEAPGAAYRPVARPVLAPETSVAVIATGKRTGKTAMSGAFTRYAVDAGRAPCVVAMGRGGPEDPVLIPPQSDLSVARLAEVAGRGEHAASDFYEDAVMTGVATIGCRRVGEGPTGEVGYSNVREGIVAAEELEIDLIVLEGSGAAIPPAHADATMLIVPASADPRDLWAMLPLRFQIAELVVITMADPRLVARDQLATVRATVDEIMASLPATDPDHGRLDTVVTAFRPTPLGDVEGRRVFVATTAPERIGSAIVQDLSDLGADVVGITHALSNRPRLRDELSAAPEHDVLLTELKAAAVDVAANVAIERGIETMFYDNRPRAVDASLEDAFGALLARADGRQQRRLPFVPPT